MYAKLNRIAIRIALCVAALGGVSVVNAGYAQLAPPPGFSGGAGAFGYAAAANDQVFGRVIHQSGALTANVGGQAVKMPAAYRLAANAPRIAAQAIFLHPGIRTAAGVALWLGAGKLVWDSAENIWREVSEPVEGGDLFWWYAPNKYSSADAACRAAYAALVTNPDAYPYAGYELTSAKSANCRHSYKNLPNAAPQTFASVSAQSSGTGLVCPAGWASTPAGCLSPAVQQPRFEELLNPANQPGWPMPDSVPQELPPGTVLPVEQPFINPAPGPNPAHRPQFVPTGNPVPNPNYDPNSPVGPANQPYLQPGVRIVPSPTPSNPWQVDMQPVDRPVGSADPNPDPQPDPEPGDGDKPKPEDQQSLCEKHPDILACSKPELDTPEDEIPRETRDVSYQPESLFGGGVCPSNKTMSTHGMQLTVWDWQENCGYIRGYFRPVIMVLCAIAAFYIVTGGARQS
ncbi:hypothetical protein [Diaphorobacter nitroreducens]|uniref:hypothetical protein n=1 Tax=Diaphorobacter nitroreducens TaxID=164759 RepID=UPI0028994E2D|nr:hypothetical protein [Diaphorobacter nitroreducens]